MWGSMRLITEKITLSELRSMSQKMFGNLVKAVVDIEQGIMVVDAGLHADQEYYLLENGSQQENLWGINMVPEQFGTKGFIVFDSMINMRPSCGNRSRSVDNVAIQEKIRTVVQKLVTP
jgi:hypothetical protein